jgi:hypothetical protein
MKVFVVRDSKRVHVHCDRSHELYDSSATPAATVVAADLAFAAVLAAIVLARRRFDRDLLQLVCVPRVRLLLLLVTHRVRLTASYCTLVQVGPQE